MDLLGLLISIIVFGLICFVLWWLVSYIGLPEPFNKVAQVLVALAAVVFLISILTGNVSFPILKFR